MTSPAARNQEKKHNIIQVSLVREREREGERERMLLVRLLIQQRQGQDPSF